MGREALPPSSCAWTRLSTHGSSALKSSSRRAWAVAFRSLRSAACCSRAVSMTQSSAILLMLRLNLRQQSAAGAGRARDGTDDAPRLVRPSGDTDPERCAGDRARLVGALETSRSNVLGLRLARARCTRDRCSGGGRHVPRLHDDVRAAAMTRRKRPGRQQLSLLDRIAPAPQGWQWSLVRASGPCDACDDPLEVGSQCLRRGALRVCADCGTRQGSTELTRAPGSHTPPSL